MDGTATNWLRLSDAEIDSLNPAQTERSDGVELHVFMSPFDVPEAVRGEYDKVQKRFVITFRYIDQEPTKEQRQDDHVTWRIGRHSGRLYGIIVDIDALSASRVKLQMHVPRALENFAKHSPYRKREGNYRAARKVIDKKSHELFELLPA